MARAKTTLSRPNALQRLVEKSGKAVVKAKRTTVAQRKANMLADLEGFEVDRLLEIQQNMAAFLNLITMSIGTAPVLTDSEAFTLMEQALARRDIAEFLDVCNGRIKEVVFTHLDTVLE